MKFAKHFFLFCILSLATACTSGGEEATHVLKKSQDAVQEKADAFIQPRIHAIEKAKGLEDKLKKIEDKRRSDIEGFEDEGP